MRSVTVIAALIFILTADPELLRADTVDLWRCGNTFTNTPANHEECTQLASSRVCGSDSNSYITPTDPRMLQKNIACKSRGNSLNPFGSKEHLKALRSLNKPKRKKIAKHFKQLKNKLPIDNLDDLIGGQNPDEIKKVFDDVAKALSGVR